MITVGRLKELLNLIPNEATVSVYEGEDTGINISLGERGWWIRATYSDAPEYISGFDTETSN